MGYADGSKVKTLSVFEGGTVEEMRKDADENKDIGCVRNNITWELQKKMRQMEGSGQITKWMEERLELSESNCSWRLRYKMWVMISVY